MRAHDTHDQSIVHCAHSHFSWATVDHAFRQRERGDVPDGHVNISSKALLFLYSRAIRMYFYSRSTVDLIQFDRNCSDCFEGKSARHLE